MKWKYNIFMGSREKDLVQSFCSVKVHPNTKIIIKNPWRVIDYFANGYVYEFKDGKGELFFLANTQPKNKHKIYVTFDKITSNIKFGTAEDSDEI